MSNVEPIEPWLEPLRKSIVVPRTPAEAFEIFTARFATWWPYDRFSLHQAETATCAIEPRAGGEVYEVSKAGERCAWGRVLAWEPPRRLVLSWHPGRPADTAQEVEFRFVEVAGGTRLELEHRGWAKLGAEARDSRASYEGGWVVVIEQRYAEACA